ncbi:CRISPR-associated endonuclease Cas1 [Legionella parisiensis]|uniref:CRISPR-associated endonuclease Cas1 n=1 Tax=Legionella parisiensis TaxID=45071 RepID=A0A1E5JMU5_9GAMM|nr:CRISPR-associated endonuclease Cas1 [Legionella parisiensis]
MEILTDLKAILHSKRANIYYLEKCRIMQKDGRVLYLTEEKTKTSIGIFLLPTQHVFYWELVHLLLKLQCVC